MVEKVVQTKSPTEVFYVIGHGIVESADVLGNAERFNMPIVSVGTQGQDTMAGPTIVLINYYMKVHGGIFMEKLFDILLEHGENYNKFKPKRNDSVEKDITSLFAMNKNERRLYPQNVLRAYYGANTLLDTTMRTLIPNETFFGMLITDTDKNSMNYFLSTFNGVRDIRYYVGRPMVDNPLNLFIIENSFGIYQFNEKEKTFVIRQPLGTESVRVSKILKYIHTQSTTKKPIVFMVHCKSPDKNVLMDFDFKEFPVEKMHKETLTQMMRKLKIKEKTRKRKTRSPPVPQPTRKRVKLSPTRAKPTKRKTRSPSPAEPTKKRTKLSPPLVANTKKKTPTNTTNTKKKTTS